VALLQPNMEVNSGLAKMQSLILLIYLHRLAKLRLVKEWNIAI
jgi:hypothetical protein